MAPSAATTALSTSAQASQELIQTSSLVNISIVDQLCSSFQQLELDPVGEELIDCLVMRYESGQISEEDFFAGIRSLKEMDIWGVGAVVNQDTGKGKESSRFDSEAEESDSDYESNLQLVAFRNDIEGAGALVYDNKIKVTIRSLEDALLEKNKALVASDAQVIVLTSKVIALEEVTLGQPTASQFSALQKEVDTLKREYNVLPVYSLRDASASASASGSESSSTNQTSISRDGTQMPSEESERLDSTD